MSARPARAGDPPVGGRLAAVLVSGSFAVTGEIVPPRAGGGAPVTQHARALVGSIDAANVTDNPTASAHMSAVAGCAFVAEAGNRGHLKTFQTGGTPVLTHYMPLYCGPPPPSGGTQVMT